jgi:tetratricopeptide (TPR) repeat protein
MSESLRDSAVNHLNEALSLMLEGKQKEASKNLEQAEETSLKAEAYDIFLCVQTEKGHLMKTLGAYEEALKIHSLTLKSTEDLLSKDPYNELYQSIFQMNLDAIGTLGNHFFKTGRFIQTKNCYELHLSISQKLLQNDTENVAYQSDVAKTFNDLGTFFSEKGQKEEAKKTLKMLL